MFWKKKSKTKSNSDENITRTTSKWGANSSVEVRTTTTGNSSLRMTQMQRANFFASSNSSLPQLGISKFPELTLGSNKDFISSFPQMPTNSTTSVKVYESPNKKTTTTTTVWKTTVPSKSATTTTTLKSVPVPDWHKPKSIFDNQPKTTTTTSKSLFSKKPTTTTTTTVWKSPATNQPKTSNSTTIWKSPATNTPKTTNSSPTWKSPATNIPKTTTSTATWKSPATNNATTSTWQSASDYKSPYRTAIGAPSTSSVLSPAQPKTSSLFKSTVASPTTTATTYKPKPITTSPTTFVKPPTTEAQKLKPGVAYIFNEMTFDNPEREFRLGSDEDVKMLKSVFGKFKVDVSEKTNATRKNILDVVERIERKDFTKISCLVLVILTHGNRHEMIATKDGHCSIDDDILFPILRNRTLRTKPKILIIQACKGSFDMRGFETDSIRVQPAGNPDEILKFYSTFEGYVSYRSKDGSIFIQAFCEYLQKYGSYKNVKEIMEMVVGVVKDKTNDLQIPTINTNLTKPYVFGNYI